MAFRSDKFDGGAQGNFYLFFVILTSSLESPEFQMKGIRYFNSIIQVIRQLPIPFLASCANS